MEIISSFLPLISKIFFILVSLFGIGFLIGFHELGHFLFCKLFNIHTPTFSIGFGPKIASKKIGDTEFIIAPILLGGYVEIAGSAEIGQGEQEHAHSQDERSLAPRPFYQKALVMLGGIMFNLMFAYGAFILVFLMGPPQSPFLYPMNARPIIQIIEKDSAAEQAGLTIGSKILSMTVNDQKILVNNNLLPLIEMQKNNPNQKAQLLIEQNGKEKEITVTIGSKNVFGETVGSLGIMFEMANVPGYSFVNAVKHGIRRTNLFIVGTCRAFISIFKNGNIKQLGGPLMVVSETIKGATAGFKIFLLFLAIISINLAVLNLIPIPIFDGGQLLFYATEFIIRRPLPARIKWYIHLASWLAILGLTLYLSVYDIARIANPYIEEIRKFLGFSR